MVSRLETTLIKMVEKVELFILNQNKLANKSFLGGKGAKGGQRQVKFSFGSFCISLFTFTEGVQKEGVEGEISVPSQG
jgi:hypothetical protein